jgi:hypothetical protein
MGFRTTDPQRSLLESEFLLPAKKRRLLEKSWAIPFREVVLPLIDGTRLLEDVLRSRSRPQHLHAPHVVARGESPREGSGPQDVLK